MKGNTVDNNEMKSVEIAPGASMIEVMRQFRQSPGTRIIRASCQAKDVPPKRDRRPSEDDTRVRPKNKQVDVWKIQYVGPTPELIGVVYRPPVQEDADGE